MSPNIRAMTYESSSEEVSSDFSNLGGLDWSKEKHREIAQVRCCRRRHRGRKKLRMRFTKQYEWLNPIRRSVLEGASGMQGSLGKTFMIVRLHLLYQSHATLWLQQHRLIEWFDGIV